jgi:16S rRNA (cytosine967-C5)-methyltransferase
MKHEVQMQKALEVIHTFTNTQPLHKFLKSYFQQHPNMGAKDRKQLTALVYNYFRLKGNRNLAHVEATVVVASAHDAYVSAFYAYWVGKLPALFHGADVNQLTEFSAADYFPLYSNVTEMIDGTALVLSHRHKPKVWIRCREARFSTVVSALKHHRFYYTIEGKNCLSFTENYPLDRLAEYEKGYFEIQDIASQKAASLFAPKENDSWWDCCAGSGGKSLCLVDAEENIQLLASDTRQTILTNLANRLRKVSFENYESIQLDVSDPSSIAALNDYADFDGIIADVPCSGSGTWSRTPEWLSFFTSTMLSDYAEKQRNIVRNVMQKLKQGKYLFYITCSVYKDENENNVRFFTEHFPLQLEKQHYFSYAHTGGDTLYVAILRKY